MRLSFVVLLTTTLLLEVSDFGVASANPNKPTIATSRDARSSTTAIINNNIKRSLRRYKTTEAGNEDDENRGLRGDFAKSDLKKMLKSESFKLKLFKKWDEHTVGHIREKLDVNPLNTRWKSLLFDYLNVYKKAGGEVVRHANNQKNVKFSNKVTVRIYRTDS